MFNEDCECLLGNKTSIGCDLTEEQKALLFVFNWLNGLIITSKVYSKIDEENKYCVFIDGVFDKIHNEKFIEFIIRELRKTGRQVFIISHNKNQAISKCVDKTFEISKVYR